MKDKEKNRKRIFRIAIILLIIIFLALLLVIKPFIAVVVKAEDNRVVCYNSIEGITYVGLSDKEKDYGFMPGQEVLIYHTSKKNEKIKLLRQESNIYVPDNILRKSYNSIDKVFIKVDKISKTRMDITITDHNLFPYNVNSAEIYLVPHQLEFRPKGIDSFANENTIDPLENASGNTYKKTIEYIKLGNR